MEIFGRGGGSPNQNLLNVLLRLLFLLVQFFLSVLLHCIQEDLSFLDWVTVGSSVLIAILTFHQNVALAALNQRVVTRLKRV